MFFIYRNVETDFLETLENVEYHYVEFGYIILTILLLFFNWGLEAVKWKYVIRKTERISILKSFKLTLTGITLGFLTPNRVGEIPGRAIILGRTNFKEIILKTGVASFGQVLITLFLGTVGLAFTFKHFDNVIDPLIGIVILVLLLFFLLMIYFKTSKLEPVLNRVKFIRERELFKSFSDFTIIELSNILMLSLLRYAVFAIQFYLVLLAFGISLTSLDEILLIPVCFLIASFIPTILISEIGVRGSVALFVFGTVSDLDIQIILASIVLWFINVGIPALLGLFNLKELKLFKED